jgi:hypothetical protein
MQLVATKYQIPPLAGIVARPSLLGWLDRAILQGHGFSCSPAPAGYGKTTPCSSGEQRKGWAWPGRTVDSSDNAPAFLGLSAGCAATRGFPALHRAGRMLLFTRDQQRSAGVARQRDRCRQGTDSRSSWTTTRRSRPNPSMWPSPLCSSMHHPTCIWSSATAALPAAGSTARPQPALGAGAVRPGLRRRDHSAADRPGA